MVQAVLWGLFGVLYVLLAIWTYRYPREHHRTVLRAFKTLEEDFEVLKEHVDGHLGRISRLKRTVRDQIVTPGEAKEMIQTIQTQPLSSRTEVLKAWRARHGS